MKFSTVIERYIELKLMGEPNITKAHRFPTPDDLRSKESYYRELIELENRMDEILSENKHNISR